MIRQTKDTVTICDESISLYQVRLLEPDFPSLPEGFEIRTYVPNVVHILTGSGVLSCHCEFPWKLGDRVIARRNEFSRLKQEYEDEETCRTKLVEQEKFNRLSWDEKRRLSYPPVEELILALWDHTFESKEHPENMSKAELLQQKRLEIKKKYPKES